MKMMILLLVVVLMNEAGSSTVVEELIVTHFMNVLRTAIKVIKTIVALSRFPLRYQHESGTVHKFSASTSD